MKALHVYRGVGTQALLRLLRHHRTGLYSLALLVGLVAGLGAIAFRLGIDAWTRLMTGTEEFVGGASTGLLAALGPFYYEIGRASCRERV